MCKRIAVRSLKLFAMVACVAASFSGSNTLNAASCGQSVPGCNANPFVGIRVCPSTFTHVGEKVGFAVRIFNNDPNGCDITNANVTLHLPNGSNVPVLANACILSPTSVGGGEVFECPGTDPRCVDNNPADYSVTVTAAMLVHGVSGTCTPVVGIDTNAPVVVFAYTTGVGTAVGSVAPDNITGCALTAAGVSQQPSGTCNCNASPFVGIRVCPSTFTHVGDKVGFTVRIFNNDASVCDITNANVTLHLPNGTTVPVLANARILSPNSVPSGDAFDCPGTDPRCVDNNPADYSVTVTAAMLVHGVSGNCTPVIGTDPNALVIFAYTTGAGTGVGSMASDNMYGCALTTVGVVQPCVTCTKTCTGGVGPNGVINFQGTVSNCTPIVNTNVPSLSALTITISDDPTATISIGGPFVLGPGQSTNYTGSYSPGTCAPSTDTITVMGQDLFCTGCAGGDAIRFGTNVTRDSLNCRVTNTCTAICTNLCIPANMTIIPSGADFILMWPTNVAGFTLQSATDLASPVLWTNVLPGPILVNGSNTVIVPGSAKQQFYRLSR